MFSQAEATEYFKELRAKTTDKTALDGIALAEKVLLDAGNAASENKVWIGIPHIGNIEWGCAKGVLIECTEKPYLVNVNDHLTSLLAWGFNHLWCDALNTRITQPSGVTRCKYQRWLLNHADISYRTPFFLDVLLEEMEKGGWDILHVPMAIKDERGLTSTGIGNADDKWGRIRRLTSTELSKLPPTFDLGDMVEVMKKTGHVPDNPVFCPNTACLLFRLDEDKWAWEFPGFTIQDRLQTRVDKNGNLCRTPQVIPEDWNLGFWAQSAGLKIGGCRKVRTNHHCTLYYTNDRVWGEEKDESYLIDNLHW